MLLVAAASRSRGFHRVNPALVVWWWELFLAMNVLRRISAQLSLTLDRVAKPSLLEFQLASYAQVVAGVATLPAAFVTIRLVRGVTTWQLQRHSAMQSCSATPEVRIPRASG